MGILLLLFFFNLGEKYKIWQRDRKVTPEGVALHPTAGYGGLAM